MTEQHEALRARAYPGRGLVAARLPDGRLSLAYFLTGRSAQSRSRRFAALSPGEVQVEDTSEGPHEDLHHDVAAVRRDRWTVAGNGDQVEPLASAPEAGIDPTSAWSAHTDEPDPPIFTPRIRLAELRPEQASGAPPGCLRIGICVNAVVVGLVATVRDRSIVGLLPLALFAYTGGQTAQLQPSADDRQSDAPAGTRDGPPGRARPAPGHC